MRTRLYCVIPDIVRCTLLTHQLQDAGLSQRYIHVLARDDISLEGLPQATILQKTELTHGIEMGLGVGGVGGMLGGLLAVTFPPAGIVLGGGALVLITALAGAGVGSVVSALIAGGIPSHELEEFRDHIYHGKILLMVDISRNLIPMMIEMFENSDTGIEIRFGGANNSLKRLAG